MAEFTENYELFNSQSSKKPSLVVVIEGLDEALSNRIIYTKIRYGDPGIVYGLPGIVYGGLRPFAGSRDLLSLDGSSLTISQRIEPEQGKGSVAMLTLAFIDKDSYMTQLLSPGVLLDDILGKSVQVFLGYEEISYPQDYFIIFRGFVSAVDSRAGLVTLQLSDPNLKRRQTVFYSAKTKLTAPVTNVATTIPVVAAGDFHQQVLGPDGTYDTAVKTYIKIEDEIIEYPPTGIVGNSFVGVTRGARGTTAVAHPIDADVFALVELQDHAIDMALKIMLSGWGGPWATDVTPLGLGQTTDPGLGIIPNSITFPDFVDVDRDYGLTLGDYVTVSGATNPANNGTWVITNIIARGDFDNNIIQLAGVIFVTEYPTPALLAFRSKYDTYPFTCGLKLTTDEVSVKDHEKLKQTFLGDSENSYRFFLTQMTNGKNFLEGEVYLPISCYSITRRGRLSVRITKPPIADDTLQILNQDNILEPQNIRISRATNTRHFFNEIDYQFDKDDAGNFTSIRKYLDVDSLSIIGLLSVLAIQSSGSRSDFSIDISASLERRAFFLLSRYTRGAVEVSLKVNWGIGNTIEAGDIVALDGTSLEISNWATGTRDFGTQLFEVLERSLDIKSGTTSLKLIGGTGAQAGDRFATISPSSVLDTSAINALIITDSYSAANPAFPSAEFKKWENYVGLPIVVHSEDYSFYEETFLISIDPGNNYQLNIDPPLSIAPPAGYIVDIPKYPLDSFPTNQSLYKTVFAHMNPTVLVVSGASQTQFDVSGGEISKFFVGNKIRIHNASYTIDSPEVFITDVTGNTVTVGTPLGFTPAAGQFIELIGYADGGGAYRFV